jgi:hypothetical protein
MAFRGIFSRFSQGLPKTGPKLIYPLPLPDTHNFLSLTKTPQFSGCGQVPGKTIAITSTKKIKIQKFKIQKFKFKIQKQNENQKLHGGPRIPQSRETSRNSVNFATMRDPRKPVNLASTKDS